MFTFKTFIFSQVKCWYTNNVWEKKQIIDIIILSHLVHAGWEGAEGRLRAAPLTTRVAKQPKAKQPYKLFSVVLLDFTNQWRSPLNEALMWSEARAELRPPRVYNVDKSPRGVRRKRNIRQVSEWLKRLAKLKLVNILSIVKQSHYYNKSKNNTRCEDIFTSFCSQGTALWPKSIHTTEI